MLFFKGGRRLLTKTETIMKDDYAISNVLEEF
jgi:hypothetical protein